MGRRFVLCVAAACGLAGCADGRLVPASPAAGKVDRRDGKVASGSPAPSRPSSKPDGVQASELGAIVGTVKAPAAVIANNGGALVSANGSGLLGNHAAGLISDKGVGYRLAALAERALAGVEVVVVDAAGNEVPGLPKAKSDAAGRYVLKGVPPGFSVSVMARVKTTTGKDARLQTLVRTSDLGTTADLTLASTYVTTAVINRQAGSLGELDPATFARAVATTAENLAEGDLPDPSDASTVVSFMDRLSGQVASLRTDLASLRKDLADIKQSLADLTAKIDALGKPASASPASPTASPSAASPPSTEPTPSGTPSASPAGSPAPAPSASPSSPGASASPSPSPPATAAAAIASFNFVNFGPDKVAGWGWGADGEPDGHFRVQLSFPTQTEVTSLVISKTMRGGPTFWHTMGPKFGVPGNPYVIGVFQGEVPVNTDAVAKVGEFTGEKTWDLYCSTVLAAFGGQNVFTAGSTYILDVKLGDGRTLSASTTN